MGLIRDLTVKEVVLPYRLGEIRLRSEDVVQKPGLSPTAEMRLNISQEKVPASVTTENDAINRIHALFMAIEYVNVVACAKYKRDGDSLVGGSLDYLAELERRRRVTPGLQFVQLADEHMRRKVYQLTTELKGEYPSFSAGQRGVMKEHTEIWSECRMEVLNGPVRRAALADLSRQPDKTPATGTPNPPGKGRRAKRTANAKARAEAEAQKERRARRSSPSGSPPFRTGAAPSQRHP